MEKSSVPYDPLSTTRLETIFTRCCFCIPLRVGCFILGYLNLIFSSIQTYSWLELTFSIGQATNGFYYFGTPELNEENPDEAYIKGLDIETIHIVGWVLVIMTLFELFWLSLNIVCLVGVHKKKPNHIWTYVGFATVRLIVRGVANQYHMNMFHDGTVSRFLDIGLSAYFISVYYIYAVRLEKEAQAVQSDEAPEVPQNVTLIYPTKMDKEHLVVKI